MALAALFDDAKRAHIIVPGMRKCPTALLLCELSVGRFLLARPCWGAYSGYAFSGSRESVRAS